MTVALGPTVIFVLVLAAMASYRTPVASCNSMSFGKPAWAWLHGNNSIVDANRAAVEAAKVQCLRIGCVLVDTSFIISLPFLFLTDLRWTQKTLDIRTPFCEYLMMS